MSVRRHYLLLGLMIGGLIIAVLGAKGVRPAARQSQRRKDSSIKVSAAASLTEAFEEMKAAFERRRPGVRVFLNIAGTEVLCTQIRLGDRPDVFASADVGHALTMKQEGFLPSFQRLAQNRLIVASPRGRAGGPRRLADLARPRVRVLMCDSKVPAGKYALDLLARLEESGEMPAGFRQRVIPNVVSHELDVKQVVTKLALGEADAGFIYATDLTPPMRERLRELPQPRGVRVSADYAVAVMTKARNPALAEEFVSFSLSPEGQRILARYGFEPPPPSAADSKPRK